tara:strand:+ start:616 stop:894 length:279 start_codon:yes stop_codon:yes gene_type:complete
MKAEDPQEARFAKDRIIEGLTKRKRTAVKIAIAQYGARLGEGEGQGNNTALIAVQYGINRANDFYATFEQVWANYCGRFWTEAIYEEDHLKS